MLDRPKLADTQSAAPTGFVEDVLPTFLSWRQQGKGCALVTVVGVDGSSPRPVGSQMAVSAEGEFVGQISSGCAEQAIVEEAVACLKAKHNRCIRYGKDSPYLDIVLPCGSGIDVFFDATIATQEIEEVAKRLARRQTACLAFNLSNLTSYVESNASHSATSSHQPLAPVTWRDGDVVVKQFTPQIQLLALGRGTIVGAITHLTEILGVASHAFSPDESSLTYAAECGAISATALTVPTDIPKNLTELTDPWTAAVLMFHDHEWEPILLNELLKTDCFYIGALGSKRTHDQRLEALRDMGCNESDVARINGPAGLDIGARTPPEIALAIVAEILKTIRTK